jgi:LPS-assembly lipoprotein
LSHKSFIFKAFCFFILVISLNACGYQPLHGKRATALNTEMQDELANIWIYEIKDRQGQILHNELLTLFNTKGRPQKPKYKLKIVYSESSTGLGISKDEFATRSNLTSSANFVLSGPISLTGQSQAVVSYNILTSPTGTEFAKRDAQTRAIKNIALDIHRRIAVHLLNAKDAKK